MAIQLIAVTCTKCSKPMQLPEHVAGLPCDAVLCEECVKRLVASRTCRHAVSNYQLDGDTGHVWCFSCKPPRCVTE